MWLIYDYGLTDELQSLDTGETGEKECDALSTPENLPGPQTSYSDTENHRLACSSCPDDAGICRHKVQPPESNKARLPGAVTEMGYCLSLSRRRQISGYHSKSTTSGHHSKSWTRKVGPFIYILLLGPCCALIRYRHCPSSLRTVWLEKGDAMFVRPAKHLC